MHCAWRLAREPPAPLHKARVKELEARVQEYERDEHYLSGFMYLAPKQMPEYPRYTHHHISTPDKMHVVLHLNVLLYQEDGSFKDASLRMSMRKVDEHWSISVKDHPGSEGCGACGSLPRVCVCCVCMCVCVRARAYICVCVCV